MIRVVVAEDHHLVREGICKLLEDGGDIQVVGEADNGRDAITLSRSLRPDVLVLDVSMPELDGLETLAELKATLPKQHVVILSMHADLGIVQQALRGGALGYILKQSVAGELLAAVRAVSTGSVYLSASVSQVLTSDVYVDKTQTLLDRLSPRERHVVERIVEGYSTKEIANSMHTSVKTVEKQRRDAMRKLGVENTASLVRVSLELGLTTRKKGMPPNG
jgi:two-component system, NarL family, invasion response regulator UvrY